jgi:acylglycerol lipase
MKVLKPIRKEELSQHNFEKSQVVDQDNNLHLYKLDYYENELSDIEHLHLGEVMVGTVQVKRQYVTTHEQDMYSLYTRVKDTSLFEEDFKATVAIVHGFGENSDIFLESALLFALNGFDVHLIDLKGAGFSGGSRCGGNHVKDFQRDVSTLLKHVNPNLPLFLYGHSMGSLTLVSYLINNVQLSIAGVILSAPFLGFTESKQMDLKKKTLIKLLQPHLEELLLNPLMPVQ